MIANSQLSVDEEANLQTALRLSMSCQVWISQSPPPPVLNILSAMSANRQDTVSESNFDATFPLTFVGALQLAEHLKRESAVDAVKVYYHLKLICAQVTVPAPPFCGAYGGHRRTTTVELSCVCVWWYAQGRLRPRQPPVPSPISCLLDSVMTPGSSGEEERVR
ncbi:unnamed protein product [Schistocephalus solidus]|uniref:Uncharacterized protein n=1 Tax=Schistocephalus solidus TaxID=70667 RepID=A0A183TSM6_SCHSO|nr:unnamed protein product [Schistocephalus solidus]